MSGFFILVVLVAVIVVVIKATTQRGGNSSERSSNGSGASEKTLSEIMRENAGKTKKKPAFTGTAGPSVAIVPTKPAIPDAAPSIQITALMSTSDSRSNYDQDKDAWEGNFYEAEGARSVQERIKFDYIDGNGKRTSRTCDVREIGFLNGDPTVIGHCNLRDATRVFRIPRMKNVRLAETEEWIRDPAQYLIEKADQQYEEDKIAAEVAQRKKDVAKLLFFIGKADGQLRSEERDILQSALCAIFDMNTTEAANLINSIAPFSLQAFKIAVNRVTKQQHGSILTNILDAAERMVATQKTVAPAEAEALQYLRAKLSKA
jgi:hypothetical protein